VLVYGAGRSLDKGMPLAVIRAEFPAAALVWAHPYRDGRIPDEARLGNHCSTASRSSTPTTRSGRTAAVSRTGIATSFTAIGGTDTHVTGYAGMYPTQFDHPVTEWPNWPRKLKAGRCRPFLKEIPRSGANCPGDRGGHRHQG